MKVGEREEIPGAVVAASVRHCAGESAVLPIDPVLGGKGQLGGFAEGDACCYAQAATAKTYRLPKGASGEANGLRVQRVDFAGLRLHCCGRVAAGVSRDFGVP